MVDKAIIPKMRIGDTSTRIGVKNNDWTQILRQHENLATCNMTRRRLVLEDPPNSKTGWYNQGYRETTIKGLYFTRGSNTSYMPSGYYVRHDAAFFTARSLLVGDEIKHDNGKYYEVKSVQAEYEGNNFLHRRCDLTHLPFHHLSFNEKTVTVDDARQRTKVYWDTYIDPAEIHGHSFNVSYENPPYPLMNVFATKGVDIVFAIGQASSTALIDYNKTPYGYNESIPTHIQTLDPEIQNLAESELRRIAEENPTGSVRSYEEGRSNDRALGSRWLFDRAFILNYTRDTD